MNRSFTFIILLSLLSFTGVSGQSPDLKETFLEAESYFLFEEYNEALPLYLKIHRAAPDNNDINYKIGICLLNDPYQKEKSISYLEKAVRDINPKYKENNYKETSAPTEAYFYLGNAYLVNNNIDKALENYRYFRDILDEKIYDVELVDEQIRICQRARELQKMPVDYDHINLGDRINSRFADINPIVSGNGKHLVYVSKRQFYDATFFSEKAAGAWLPPRNIIPELEVDGDVYPTSLSWNGDTMIIYRNDNFIGNLYMSRLEDGRWTGLEKLGDNINTKYWESHGSLSRDGNTLYFTSNRKGGYGGLDIYRSEKQPDGTWGEPVNLGENINTRYNEETPFISENGQKLFFSSYGHYNMGGYDIFYSKRGPDGTWGEPVNLGYPINTTDDDLFFLPFNNGINAYMAKYLPGGYGRHDLYYLEIYSENNPRMYLVTGSVRTGKGDVSAEDSLAIYLVDRETEDTVFIGKPDLAKQEFSLEAPQGGYHLVFDSRTHQVVVRDLDIDEQTDINGIILEKPVVLEPVIREPDVFMGEESRITVRDSLFEAEPGVPFRIKLRLEKGSTLYSTHYADTLLIAQDTFEVDRRRFEVEIQPVEGENRVELIMEEPNGDRSISEVKVLVPEAEPEETGEAEEMESQPSGMATEHVEQQPAGEQNGAVAEQPAGEQGDTLTGGAQKPGERMQQTTPDAKEPAVERKTEEPGKKGPGGVLIGGGLLLAGILVLIIFLIRKRRKEQEEG